MTDRRSLRATPLRNLLFLAAASALTLTIGLGFATRSEAREGDRSTNGSSTAGWRTVAAALDQVIADKLDGKALIQALLDELS